MQDVLTQAKKAKEAVKLMRLASTEAKNSFLEQLASSLEEKEQFILEENKKDLQASEGITAAMKRRLELSSKSIQGMAAQVRQIASLPDPVGETVSSWVRDDGLRISKVRTPIGAIAFIFESRPNVVVDVAALCAKSGNVVIFRGGKEAMHSNNALASLISAALAYAGLPVDAVQQLEDRRYEAVNELVALDEYLDLAIPRGRESLIKAVSEHARVPVIKHVRGLCHSYIDKDADPEKAVNIIVNAKTSNPATCNSIETALVHADIAPKVMPRLLEALIAKGVEVRGCPRTCAYNSACVKATEEDWDAEYLDLILAVKVVDSFDEAIDHIGKHSSGLTDSIVTENKEAAKNFERLVDSATVLVNASNRLTDGGEFGLGGEIGISTARIHMRGPMGVADLTVTKYVVEGDGHIRK